MGIILIILVVGLAAWLLVQHRETSQGTTPVISEAKYETPLEILSKRYARGEIDRTEFEARKRDLI